MPKKKFHKTAIAKIPEKPLVYGGTDMYNEEYYKATKTKRNAGKRK